MTDVAPMLREIRTQTKLSQPGLAQLLGTSLVSVDRWERGASSPSPAQTEQIRRLHQALREQPFQRLSLAAEAGAFSSRGVRRRHAPLPLFDGLLPKVNLSPAVLPPILGRLARGRFFASAGHGAIGTLLQAYSSAAVTAPTPPPAGMSAGKNSYTYDAHTYHTKVPPQGIAELLGHYLPDGGLVLDPFAGSGMTGVAARVRGCASILNELSPAACFIADRFTASSVAPDLFKSGVNAILEELRDLREMLYTTRCRECGRSTEILYTVWSYNVLCDHCGEEFLLWDHCREYGRTVREHKILREFPCPHCRRALKKSSLRRTAAQPVQLGYKCCGSRQQEVTHALDAEDWARLQSLETAAPLADGFYPRTQLPEGVNLRQPAKHGLDRVDKFYTPRNLAAMSHIWKAIHRIESTELAAYLAFVHTSLYQRVTRLAEFRFWGGSGNTARFNVPYIFNEANVFITFARKARTIQDHLEAAVSHYRGSAVVVQNSATTLDYLPDESIDLVFTDPPFGANINYSDMNFLWESWLGAFTDTASETIVNKVQRKGVAEYQQLMTQSLRECYRVLRPDHWLLLVFMNSSQEVWAALKSAIVDAGFEIHKADIFDKQHGTFKQFVSDNTAGADLVLHCLKPATISCTSLQRQPAAQRDSVVAFLEHANLQAATNVYMHVGRGEEVDFRTLYSQWLTHSLLLTTEVISFAQFRAIVQDWLRRYEPPS